MAHIDQSMCIAAMRRLFRAIKGAIMGSITRVHQLIVRVLGVAVRGVRNEVVAAIDNTLGLPRESVRVPATGPVEDPTPIAVAVEVGNDQAQGER